MIKTSIKDGEVAVFMPLKLKKRGGRRMILAPDGVQPVPDTPNIDQTLLKALVKAHLWKRQLKSGRYPNMKALCDRYNITVRYAQIILRLNFLAPKFKEAIINGTQPRNLKLADLIHNVPLLWVEQQELFGIKILDEDG